MADRIVDILLVGGGIASATAAETLRDEGFDGSILLVGRELDPPYHRPPCSKGYLQGKEPREEGLLHPAAWWGEHGVELLTRTGVLELDAGAKTAALSTGEEVGFHHALLATGSLVRRLHVDGASLEGIHYLRTAGNSDTIRDDTDHAEQVVCVGGSYIGCEVAATLTERGKRMTILMQEDEPLSSARSSKSTASTSSAARRSRTSGARASVCARCTRRRAASWTRRPSSAASA